MAERESDYVNYVQATKLQAFSESNALWSGAYLKVLIFLSIGVLVMLSFNHSGYGQAYQVSPLIIAAALSFFVIIKNATTLICVAIYTLHAQTEWFNLWRE